jgi:membrane associated rhomboid family serine protease
MIPLRDVIPSRSTPYAALALIAVTLAAWLGELALSPGALPALLWTHGVVPADLRAPSLVTALFLHVSWVQVVGNLWALWIFGDNVEGRLGRLRFVGFYLLCGCAALLAHAAIYRSSMLPAVGAGGAVAGVMGAYFVEFPRSRVLTLVPVPFFVEIIEVPAAVLLGCWLLTQAFDAGTIAVTAGVPGGSPAAIAAGFLAGAAGLLLVRKLGRPDVRWA